MKNLLLIIITTLLLCVGCGDNPVSPPDPWQLIDSYSFNDIRMSYTTPQLLINTTYKIELTGIRETNLDSIYIFSSDAFYYYYIEWNETDPYESNYIITDLVSFTPPYNANHTYIITYAGDDLTHLVKYYGYETSSTGTIELKIYKLN